MGVKNKKIKQTLQYCSSNSGASKAIVLYSVQYCNCESAYVPASLLHVQFCASKLARYMSPCIRPFQFFVCAFPRCCCPVCVDVVVSALFVSTVHSLTMLLFCTRNCSQEFSLKLWAPELQRNCQTPARSRTRCRGWVLIRCYHYLWAFVHFCLSFDTRAVSAFFWIRCCLEFA